MSLKTITTIIWIIILNLILSAQTKLSLDNAIELALKKNLTLEKTNLQDKSYELNIKQSYGNLLPDLNANASVSHTNSKNFLGKNSTNSYSAGIGSNIVLFDGLANLYSIDKAKISYDIYKNQLERLKQQITYTVSELYYNTLMQWYLLKVDEETVKWNEKNLEYINDKFRLGATTRADLYNQELKLGLAKSKLIATKNAYSALKDQLINYIGLDVMQDYELSSPEIDIDSSYVRNELNKYQNIYSLIDDALKYRLDYKVQQLNYELARYDYKIANSGFYPILSAGWNFNLNSDKFSNFGKYYSNTFSLNLSIPIFNKFSTDIRTEQFKISESIREKEITEIERNIKTELKKNILDLTNSVENYLVSIKTVKSAEENKKIIEEKYRLKAETLMNLMLAEVDYVNAKTQKITAVFEIYKNLAKVKYLIGK